MTRLVPIPLLRTLAAFGAAALCLGLSGCLKPFEVNVNTPEPIKVDLSVDVNVYQYGGAEKKKADETSSDFREAMNRTRNRMGEIQELKNNRLIGEGHDGLLSIRNRPAGDYGDYVEKTVAAENQDREILMRHEAEEEKVPLETIRGQQWSHRQRKAFPGEWIEAENDGGSGFRWIQKQGTAETDGQP